MKIFYSAVLIFCFCISCKETKKPVSVDGLYVSAINNKLVRFSDSDVTLDLSESNTIYYLVRHAEKDTIGEPGNPPLTARGDARSEALKDILKGTKVDEIYSSMYLRTLMTAEPLASSKGMKILPYNPSRLRAFADTLSQRNDLESVLIVGHSNTTPALANALSGSNHFNKNIDESDYDNLYIVASESDSTWNSYALRFGIPSEIK